MYLEHEQQQRLLQFLMGLNDSYMNVKSQILMMSPLPAVGQTFSLLSQEESRRTLSSVENPVATFYANQTQGGKTKEKLICEHCNWNGHAKENCYKLVGYPQWHRLYKGPNKGPNKKLYKDNLKYKKTSGDADLVEGSNAEMNQSETATEAPLFTPSNLLKF